MERVAFIERKGKSLLHVDLPGLKNPDDIVAVLGPARQVIDSQPPKSLLLLTNCLDTHYEARGPKQSRPTPKPTPPSSGPAR